MKLLLSILTILLSSQMIQAQEWQYNDTTSVITVHFSKNMNIVGLRDTANYKMVDDNNKKILIYKIAIVSQIGDSIITDTSVVALITKKINDNKVHRISVSNVTDINNLPLDPNKQPVILNNKNYIIDIVQPELKK